MPHDHDPEAEPGVPVTRRPDRSAEPVPGEYRTDEIPRGIAGPQDVPPGTPATPRPRRRPDAMPTEQLPRGTGGQRSGYEDSSDPRRRAQRPDAQRPEPPRPEVRRPDPRRSGAPLPTGGRTSDDRSNSGDRRISDDGRDSDDRRNSDDRRAGDDRSNSGDRRAAADRRIADDRRAAEHRSRSPHPDGSRRSDRSPGGTPRPAEVRGAHLPPYAEPDLVPPAPGAPGMPGMPRKLTVTRIAAMRSKQLTSRGVDLFRKAATADGADRSGLTHLTYAVMANYAVDAALTVALANTLFFAAASAESTGKVLLYLLITVAPFAVIAPFIGPLLDKIQHGRRIALAATSFGRSLLAIVMAFNFNSWVLYPCALGMMVLSKSFGVLKAALTPRVLPEQITLVKTNSRLTVFGLVAGGVAGGVAAAFAGITNASGALIWTALCGIAGGVLCLRIPAWVESTEGEVPVQHSEVLTRGRVRRFPPSVSATLWANMANRIETGFLALFIAFVVKTEYAHLSGFQQLLVLGIVGAAAGLGGFVGNALGAQLTLAKPDVIAAWGVVAVGVTCLVAIMIPGIAMAAVVGLVGSTSSSLAKVCLDSVIQDRLPEASRASAFGMSESLLQLAWVSGGVVGLLLGGVLHLSGDGVYMLGFAVVTLMVGLGVTQSWLSRTGRALVPGIAAAWDRRANRRFARSKSSSGAVEPPRTARFGATGAVDDRHGFEDGRGDDTPPTTQQVAQDQPTPPSGRVRRPRKAGDPRR